MDENKLDGLDQGQGESGATDTSGGFSEDARVAARRRFLKGVASASPILLTLPSRPVLACFCTSASAAMSGTLMAVEASNRPRQVPCNGRSPGYWKTAQRAKYWPTYQAGTFTPTTSGDAKPTLVNGVHIGGGTLFHSVFPGSKFGNKTFLQILYNKQDGWGTPVISATSEEKSLARYVVTGALNLAAGFWPSDLIPLEVLKQIYFQIIESSNHYYETSTGDKMYLDDAKEYLSNMWD